MKRLFVFFLVFLLFGAALGFSQTMVNSERLRCTFAYNSERNTEILGISHAVLSSFSDGSLEMVFHYNARSIFAGSPFSINLRTPGRRSEGFMEYLNVTSDGFGLAGLNLKAEIYDNVSGTGFSINIDRHDGRNILIFALER